MTSLRHALVFGMALLPTVAASAQTTPFPLGTYVGNPDGTSAANEAAFETQLASFAATLGAMPQYMNAFTDFTQPPSSWPGNASWTAWSWSISPVVGHTIIPVIGIPMSDHAHWYQGAGNGNDLFFRAVVAGLYDADYAGIVDAWARNGFKTMYLRVGYEMDGGFMPWFMGDDWTTQADWVAAFRHLSTLIRLRARHDRAVAHIVWNPVDINWTPGSVEHLYPGNGYVDVICTDTYSALYPTSLYDWALNNWTYDKSLAAWWTDPLNNAHFWTYPGANPWQQTGASGWGMADTIRFAWKHRKPLAICEAGAGGNGVSTGPIDEPQFPKWLAASLDGARKQHVAVTFVNVWDTDAADGNWDFSSASSTKPDEAAAWRRRFGPMALNAAAGR